MMTMSPLLDLHVLALERALEVRRRDLVARRQLVNALELRDVDQHAARDDGADVLDAELGEPLGLGELGAAIAVVEQVADAEVTEAVELRADLPELAADDLVVIDRLVLPGILKACGMRRL